MSGCTVFKVVADLEERGQVQGANSRTRIVSERAVDMLLDSRLYHGAPYAVWQILRYMPLTRKRPGLVAEIRVPLNVCVTVDLESDYRSPGTVSSAQAFLPRFAELCAAQDIRATFYCQGDVIPAVADQLRAIRTATHELGLHGLHHEVWGRARWTQYSLGYPSLQFSERQRRLEGAVRAFADAGLGRPKSFRAPYLNIDRGTLRLLRSYGFTSDSSPASFLGTVPIPRKAEGLWQVPVTSRPFPSIAPRGLQLFRYPELTLEALLSMPVDQLTDMSWLARTLQEAKGFPPYIVMLLHPWEFVTNPQVPYASPANYDRLRAALDVLACHFAVRMLTVSQLVEHFPSSAG